MAWNYGRFVVLLSMFGIGVHRKQGAAIRARFSTMRDKGAACQGRTLRWFYFFRATSAAAFSAIESLERPNFASVFWY
jgi:hypothetical protein